MTNCIDRLKEDVVAKLEYKGVSKGLGTPSQKSHY